MVYNVQSKSIPFKYLSDNELGSRELESSLDANKGVINLDLQF